MNNFAEFARYYDLFYRDKDYAMEARFVDQILRRHAKPVESILELGCGTGRHAIELARFGYNVTGVDRSAEMVARAQAAAAALPAEFKGRFTVREGDVTQLETAGVHDAVLSLFHVVNYQTTNAALRGMFASARKALATGGVFVFDFWYGPAVLADKPQPRIRRAQQGDENVIRIAQPELHVNANTVDVNYTLLVTDKAGAALREYQETHVMRYLFLPEIEMLAQTAGFELIDSGTWLTSNPLDESSWLGWTALRAI